MNHPTVYSARIDRLQIVRYVVVVWVVWDRTGGLGDGGPTVRIRYATEIGGLVGLWYGTTSPLGKLETVGQTSGVYGSAWRVGLLCAKLTNVRACEWETFASLS